MILRLAFILVYQNIIQGLIQLIKECFQKLPKSVKEREIVDNRLAEEWLSDNDDDENETQVINRWSNGGRTESSTTLDIMINTNVGPENENIHTSEEPGYVRTPVRPEYKTTVRPEYKPSVRREYRPSVRPEDIRTTVRPEYRPSVRIEYRPSVRPEYRPSVRPEYKPSVRPVYKPSLRPEDIRTTGRHEDIGSRTKISTEATMPNETFANTGNLNIKTFSPQLNGMI